MRKLLTNFNGKMPWFLDDWRFQNDEYLSLFNALANSYYAQTGLDFDNFVIVGCVVTDEGSQWKITDGWAVIQRRFVRVNETFLNKDNTKNFVLRITTTTDSTGDRVTADNNPISPWQVTEGRFIATQVVTPNTDILLISTTEVIGVPLTIWGRTRERIGYTGWSNFANFQNSWENTPGGQFRRVPGSVEFRGRISNPEATLDVTTNQHLFTLTEGNRPSVDRTVTCVIPDVFNNDSEWSNIAIIQILTNGQVRLRGDLRKVRVKDVAGLSLDGVSFSL